MLQWNPCPLFIHSKTFFFSETGDTVSPILEKSLFVILYSHFLTSKPKLVFSIYKEPFQRFIRRRVAGRRQHGWVNFCASHAENRLSGGWALPSRKSGQYSTRPGAKTTSDHLFWRIFHFLPHEHWLAATLLYHFHNSRNFTHVFWLFQLLAENIQYLSLLSWSLIEMKSLCFVITTCTVKTGQTTSQESDQGYLSSWSRKTEYFRLQCNLSI